MDEKLLTLPVLSIRQPWAWLIVNGFKDVENRCWRTNIRGQILIHASKRMDNISLDDIEDLMTLVGAIPLWPI